MREQRVVLEHHRRAAAYRRQEVLDGFRAAAPPHEQQGWQPTASQVQAAIRAARQVQAFPETARADSDGRRLSRGTPRDTPSASAPRAA